MFEKVPILTDTLPFSSICELNKLPVPSQASYFIVTSHTYYENSLQNSHTSMVIIISYFNFFSTGLVRLYIAGLPLRSCRIMWAPSVQGSV